MTLHLNPIVTRRVGVTLLTIGVLGTLARVYISGVRAMPYGTVIDFLLGLFIGLGIALSLVTDWHGTEDESISIRPSADI
jgi:hypothetical protein